jgi:hypothetical protein
VPSRRSLPPLAHGRTTSAVVIVPVHTHHAACAHKSAQPRACHASMSTVVSPTGLRHGFACEEEAACEAAIRSPAHWVTREADRRQWRVGIGGC